MDLSWLLHIWPIYCQKFLYVMITLLMPVSVLVLAGVELKFFTVACIVLWLVFVTKTVLITQDCFYYCWAALTQSQGLFYFCPNELYCTAREEFTDLPFLPHSKVGTPWLEWIICLHGKYSDSIWITATR